MIELNNITKHFENRKALDNISAVIEEGHVYGLIGTNGAGKSTLMRTICGIYRQDEGKITVDGEEVYENDAVKSQIFYISDDQYFHPNASASDMVRFYTVLYPGFDRKRFDELMAILSLDKNCRIHTFSKGMKKQLSVLLGICAGTKYLLCDETFDGLDPVMRKAVKNLFIQEIDRRGLTPIIASHNLRELEDICDQAGLLHKGGILFSRDLEEMKLNIHKVQCVMQDQDISGLSREFDILKVETRGSLFTLTLRGTREEVEQRFAQIHPLFYELLPLSLEEIFISETEVVGYDFKNLIF